MKKPFFYISIILCIGIIAGDLFILNINYYEIVLIIDIILSLLCYIKGKNLFCFIFLILFYFIAGVILYQISWLEYYENSLYKALYKNKEIPLYEPVYIEFKLDGAYLIEREKLCLIGQVLRIIYQEDETKTAANVKINIKVSEELDEWKKWKHGDVLSAFVIFKEPIYHKNKGAFNIFSYLFINRLHLNAMAKSIYLIKRIRDSDDFILLKWCYYIREYVSDLIEKYFSSKGELSQAGALLKAMLIGRRNSISEETNELFQKSGLFHLIAISGFNVNVIYLFIYFLLCKVLLMGKRLVLIILIMILPFFIIISSASASVLRAALMSFLVSICYLMYQRIQLLNLVGVSALVILIVEPYRLFDIGFQLTYLVTFALITMGQEIYNNFTNRMRYIFINLSFSLSSLIIILPHSLILFRRISLIAIVLNLIAVPIFSSVLILGIMLIMIPIDIIRVSISFVIKVMLWVMMEIASKMVSMPLLVFNFNNSNTLLILLLEAFMISAVYLKGIKGKVIAVIICVLIIVGMHIGSEGERSGVFWLTMFDVGIGESMLLQFPDKTVILIDGGGSPNSSFDVGREILRPALLTIGVNKIDYVMLTHEHHDHKEGLVYVLKEMKTKELWDANCSPKNYRCSDLINIASNKNIFIRRLKEGDRINIGNASIEVLHSPINNRSKKINNNSLVVMVKVFNRKLLLTGDIEIEVERELINRYGKLIKANIIKIPHHGSKSSSSGDFVDYVSANIGLLSVGVSNFFSLPNRDVIKRYLYHRSELYRTDINGQIYLSVYPNGDIKVDMYSP